MKTLDQITTEIEGLTTRANELLATAQEDGSKVVEVKSQVETIQSEIAPLLEQREHAVQAEEHKSLITTVKTLSDAVENLRKPDSGFVLAPDSGTPEGKALDENNPYAGGEFSPYVDIVMAGKGSAAARERLTYGSDRYLGDAKYGWSQNAEGKAMTEGTQAQGGYLVQPELERQLVLAREKDNVLRPLCTSLAVTTNAIQLDQLGIKTGAAWVAELATKFEETGMSILSVTASVFTAAGLATISNQLLQDSNPAVDQLVTADLAKRIVALEETAFMTGSGTGQPLGILNTSGVNPITYTESSAEDPSKAGGLLDQILIGIATTQEQWGQPSAIVMHPRTWTAIIKSRDAAGHYTIAPRNNFNAGYDPATPRTFINGPEQTLFGVPVTLSNRVPTNLGAGTNESRVIIGDFQEALILDRQGITVDESSHVYFVSNQTVFRAESRVGFTAARQPKAFTVIGGTGLANR